MKVLSNILPPKNKTMEATALVAGVRGKEILSSLSHPSATTATALGRYSCAPF